MWPAGCRHLKAGRAGQGRGREAAGLMGPRTPEGYGAARRGATSFPLASTGAKQREGGREGGRGRWRLLTAEPGRSPPAAAESRTRVADPGVSETKRGMPGCGGGLGLFRTPPAPRRGAQRSPPRCRSRPGSRRGAERSEGRSLRGAGQRGRAAACMPSGRGAAARPWWPLQPGPQRGCRLQRRAPGAASLPSSGP